MNNRTKNIIYSLCLLIFFAGLYWYRNREKGHNLALQGNTMGTTYSVKYIDEAERNFQPDIDSLLRAFNQVLSTYIPDSDISQFNADDSARALRSPYFYEVLRVSEQVYRRTQGAFDPTVGPLVNAWGFGPDNRRSPDSTTVDSLRRLVGYDQIAYSEDQVAKARPGLMLDFSAIAKGYGVDLVGEYLEAQGVENYFVEIGGEVRCRGNSPTDQPWRVGIENPQYDAGGERLKATVQLRNRAMATSGNYRNFYVIDGRKYAHTIDPRTGYPVQHSLLSASVFAPDCMTADAYATAFMVMGREAAVALLQDTPDLDAYLIFSDAAGEVLTYSTEGIRDAIGVPTRRR